VRIVFSTSGDGYPRAAARLAGKTLGELGPADFMHLGETRRAEALAADRELGLTERDLVHLGFPDGSFDKVMAATGSEPFRSPLTQLVESPTTRAPYTRRAALDAFSAVLNEFAPSEVYVTDAADEHGDHSATHQAVTKAMKTAGSTARLFTFMVHAAYDRWPDPGPRFETKTIDGVVYPRGVKWPPPVRVPLLPGHAANKFRALKKNESQWALDHDYLGAFVKSEEVFWT
jgi:LmbE family N-acetylglucosaminyl deacetylase